MQNVQFMEKENTRECMVGAKSCAQGDEKLEEKPGIKAHTANSTTPEIILQLLSRNS